MTLSPSADVLIESAHVGCTLPAGQAVAVSLGTYNSTFFPHALPLHLQGRFGSDDRYSAAVPMKAFHKTIQPFGVTALPSVAFTRSDSSGILNCTVTVDGIAK